MPSYDCLGINIAALLIISGQEERLVFCPEQRQQHGLDCGRNASCQSKAFFSVSAHSLACLARTEHLAKALACLARTEHLAKPAHSQSCVKSMEPEIGYDPTPMACHSTPIIRRNRSMLRCCSIADQSLAKDSPLSSPHDASPWSQGGLLLAGYLTVSARD